MYTQGQHLVVKMFSSDAEMVCVDEVESPTQKEPIKPCTIRLMRDRDIDQRSRKKCKKNEAGIHAFAYLSKLNESLSVVRPISIQLLFSHFYCFLIDFGRL